jgi:hypothetical protein
MNPKLRGVSLFAAKNPVKYEFPVSALAAPPLTIAKQFLQVTPFHPQSATTSTTFLPHRDNCFSHALYLP